MERKDCDGERAVTLVMAYYENPDMLRQHCRVWQGYPEDVRARVRVLLVDDGSPRRPARDALRAAVQEAAARGAQLPQIRLLRIQPDVPWNQDGARNLGLHLFWRAGGYNEHLVGLYAAGNDILFRKELERHSRGGAGFLQAPEVLLYVFDDRAVAPDAETRCLSRVPVSEEDKRRALRRGHRVLSFAWQEEALDVDG